MYLILLLMYWTELLLLTHFNRVQLCATPYRAAHQAPPSLGFSRQEHWSGLPFPSAVHESEKWKWSRSVVSDSQRPHGLQPTRLLCPWDFPGKSTGVGCHCLLQQSIKDVFLKKFFAIKRIVIRLIGKSRCVTRQIVCSLNKKSTPWHNLLCV